MFFKKKYTLSQVVDFIIKATHVKDYYNLVVIRTSDNTTFVISNKEPIGQDGAYGILMGGFDTYIDIFNRGFNSDLRSINGVNLKHRTNETDLLKAIYRVEKLLEYEAKFHLPNVWTERKPSLGNLLAEKMSNNKEIDKMTQEINLNEITVGVEILANLLNKHPGLISRFTFSKKDNRIGEFKPTPDGVQLNIIDPTRMGQIITTYKEDSDYLCFTRFFNELKLPSVLITLTPYLESLMKEEGMEFTNSDHKEIFAFLKLLMTNTVNADMYRIPLQGDKSLVLKMVGKNTTQAIICREDEVKDIICGKDILKIDADIRHLSSTPKTALKELLEHYGNLGQELKLNMPCFITIK